MATDFNRGYSFFKSILPGLILMTDTTLSAVLLGARNDVVWRYSDNWQRCEKGLSMVLSCKYSGR